MRFSFFALLVVLVGCNNAQSEPAQGTSASSSSSMSSSMEASSMGASSMGELPDEETMLERARAAGHRLEIPVLPYTAPTDPIERPAGVARPAFEAGMWVRYRVAWQQGGRSTIEYRLISREDDAWWLEVIDQRPGGTRIVKMTVAVGDRTNIDDVEVRSVTIKAGSRTQEIPARVLPGFQPMLRQWLNPIFSTWDQDDDGETVEVPAGTFTGAVKAAREIGVAPRTIQADVWYHNAVPMTGMVRFQPEGNDAHSLEVEGFGTGANSLF